MRNRTRSYQNSDGKSIISRRWKVDVKETVNEYNFHLEDYHRSGGKCDFCGSNLIYVAEIDGEEINGNGHKHYAVGFDCLNLVFGAEWTDHEKADRVLKQMKNEATVERRKEKYATEYADMIEWLNSEHYQNFINANDFLRDMKVILTTGSRIFTSAMQSGVRRFMERSYDADEFEKKLKHHKEVVLPKIKMVYDMVVRMDGIDDGNVPKWSAFNFVKSVYLQARDANKVSPAQLEALNKVYSRYVKRMERNNDPEFQKLVDEVPY